MKALPFLKPVVKTLLERSQVVKRVARFGESIECGHYLAVGAITFLELIKHITG